MSIKVNRKNNENCEEKFPFLGIGKSGSIYLVLSLDYNYNIYDTITIVSKSPYLKAGERNNIAKNYITKLYGTLENE